MADIHILTPQECREIIKEELKLLLDALRGQPASLEACLTTEDVAKITTKTEHTVRGWIRAGRLRASRPKGTRDYQIKRSDLESFLAYGGSLDTHEEDDEVDLDSSARKILERASRPKE